MNNTNCDICNIYLMCPKLKKTFLKFMYSIQWSVNKDIILCLQVEWSPSNWLWQRCRDQNHHEDYLPRGSYPETWKLWKRLTFCIFCFQTAGFQVAQTDGLQGETGEDIFKFLKSESHNHEHIKRTKTAKWSRNGNSQVIYMKELMECLRNI